MAGGTELDFPQIIQSVYDPTNEALNVNAEITANISGPQEVIVSSVDDSITIGDMSGHFATVTNGALNVNATISGAPSTIKIEDTAGNPLGSTSGALNVSVQNFPSSQTVSGTVSVNLNGLNTFQTSQYTVGTSSVQLTSSPLSNRKSVAIKAVTTGGAIVYIGNSSSVTTSNGWPLFNNDALEMDLTPSDVIWAIASSSGQTVAALELG